MAFIAPTFEDREKLTAGKLNLFGAAVESKFSAITGGDLAWPFVVEGDIDFGSLHSIVGLRSLWNIINVGDYTPLNTASFKEAVAAAVTAGGGCLLIPPNTTAVCDGVDIAQDGITILGCGASSVLQLTTGSTSGYMFKLGVTNQTDLAIMNLTIDGQSTGTAQAGVIMQYVEGFTMRDVVIKNFTGDAVHIDNEGVDGHSCKYVTFDNVRFEGGGASHIKVEDVDFLTLENVTCIDAGAAAITMAPSGATALIKHIQLSNVQVSGTTGIGVWITADGAASDSHSIISLANCVSIGGSDDAFRIGETGKMLKHVTMDNCIGHDATNNGLTANITYGIISNNHFRYATDDGIDLISSTELVVTGNNCRDAQGDYGIDADGTTSCSIHDNDVTGYTTQGILLTNATTAILGPNQGMVGPTLNTVISDYPHEQRTSTGNYTATYTIPANTLKIGDHIRITAYFDLTGWTADTVIPTTRIDAQNLGGVTTSAVGLIKTVVDIHINGLTGANTLHSTISSWSPNAAGTSGIDVGLTQTLTVDLTTDTVVSASVVVTDTATIYFEQILIEWLGGNE